MIRERFYKFTLSLSSFSLSIMMYLLTIDIFPKIHYFWLSVLKFIALLVVVVLLAVFDLYLTKKKDNKKDDNIVISSIQSAEHEVVPSYLGLFVIMFGLGELALIHQFCVMVMLFIVWWLFMEKSYYFNLTWLAFYRYYKVTDIHGNEYAIYSKRKDFKLNKNDVKFGNLIRINNFIG